MAGDSFIETGSYLQYLLNRHGYGQRIITVSSDGLPILAEMYDHGKLELCIVTGFQASGNNEWTAPLVKVQLASNELDKRTVDFGQITTIWDASPQESLESWRIEAEKEMDKFPVQHGDRAMQRVYQSRAGPPRKTPSSALSKKQVTKLVSNSPDESRAHTESVLRKVVKTGAGMSRLADSSIAMDYLYNDYPKNKQDTLRRRIAGAHILAQDAELGGRFRRMPCTFVSADYDEAANKVNSVTLINGGWLAVDQSVRAGTEARKFAKRAETARNDKTDSSTSDKVQLMTAADERIAQRLESLAMGELFAWDSNEGNEQQQEEETKLEVDVREALKAMGLPTTPEGAQEALLRIGRWSQKPDQVRLQPWPQSTLDAARCFADMDKERRFNLYQKSFLARGTKAKASALEKRADLTMLPCVCVDAKRTTFRDDAIGVRPRSMTGRKVVADASKYEIMIHIADVSDIYAPKPFIKANPEKIQLLREAAENRGMSRYDLPLGPLHLMPPVVLDALSLKTNNVDMTSKESEGNEMVECCNRCVTLWAYIDERNGKVIDAGLERTLISTPIALSFADATDLLEGKVVGLQKAKAILSVVERNLLLWSAQHRQSNKAAQKRETRLSIKELVAKEMQGSKTRDDGRHGFQRTRGHKVVDAALDLYGYGVSSLLRRAKAPIPRASGSGASRGGRVATAPLRRYIDGVAQRQALSVLCGYGGPQLTREACVDANKVADKANIVLSNIRAVKQSSAAQRSNRGRQQNALRLLQADLNGKDRPIPAMSTGRENEVAILGVGAVAKCRGVKGSLKPGAQVMVKVRRIDAEKGILSVSLVQDGQR